MKLTDDITWKHITAAILIMVIWVFAEPIVEWMDAIYAGFGL